MLTVNFYVSFWDSYWIVTKILLIYNTTFIPSRYFVTSNVKPEVFCYL